METDKTESATEELSFMLVYDITFITYTGLKPSNKSHFLIRSTSCSGYYVQSASTHWGSRTGVMEWYLAMPADDKILLLGPG